ncbi:MAG: catalase/peroxidase HPI [Candidatus Sericytochromatia bacterium]|nr:catalase/peroxidase HPI [Candidatus Sericytochromatia bacterium]
MALLPLASPQAALAARKTPQDWWPQTLDLQPLRAHGAASNPYGGGFDYAAAFQTLDLGAVKKDLRDLMTQSQDWWPADFGHYGPFLIRMAWHIAGTYRVQDGRGGADGGQQRFEPINSWPDNANLDKARRLLWPIKRKYGRKLSWGDLMVLAGNVALESMGFKTLGFAGGRVDQWETDPVDWGPETEMLADKRHGKDGQLENPLAAVQMGLIYVNPEGPGGKPDPLAAAKDIRETFGRMAMNDEETVALIAGGHTFGKAHGAHAPERHLGPAPAGAGLEEQGLGWRNSYGKGKAEHTFTSGLEGAWTFNPTAWTTQYLDNLFRFTWKQIRSPGGAIQWGPTESEAAGRVPDAHDPTKRHAPIMFTTDLALRFDPAYQKIARSFLEDPKAFELAFAKAWFKLTHRDLGPRHRYLGAEVPKAGFTWQDPVPYVQHPLVDAAAIKQLKGLLLRSGLTIPQLVRTAWASASTYRQTDMRGGANGARIRLEPQRSWQANDPQELRYVLHKLEDVQRRFARMAPRRMKISLADLIVLGGAAALEKAAGYRIKVPFRPGRTDATQAQTEVNSFAYLKPTADGFRNYYTSESPASPVEMLVERAYLLNLTVPEMTVLVGGLRALGANVGGSSTGVLTDRPGTLSPDFFVNLLDMQTRWAKSSGREDLYEGYDRRSGKLRWTASPVDLVFGSNPELRAVAEAYAADDARDMFLKDFVAAWNKVMELDRR